jgi:hypothetical protein
VGKAHLRKRTKSTVSFKEISTMFLENFNLFTGTGLAPEPNSGQLNSNAWILTGFSQGNTNFGGTATSGDFARGVSTGGVSTGGVYSFTIANENNILGVQPVGDDFKIAKYGGNELKSSHH